MLLLDQVGDLEADCLSIEHAWSQLTLPDDIRVCPGHIGARVANW